MTVRLDLTLPRAAAFLLIVFMGLHLAFLLIGGPLTPLRSTIANLGYLPVFAMSTYLALSAAQQSRRSSETRTWNWIAAGLIFWYLGSLAYVFVDNVFHLTLFPSLADVFYLASPPCITCGLLHLRREKRSVLNRLNVFLDVAMVVLIIGDLLWSTSVHSTITSYPGQPFALSVALAYPAADLLLCALLVTLALWQPTALARKELLLLSAGMASFLTADAIYAHQVGLNTYQPGTLLDAGWSLMATLFGIAAYLNTQARHGAASRPGRVDPERWAPLPPHYAVLLIFTLYIYTHVNPANLNLDRVGKPILLLVTGLFILRQVVVLTHNHHLQVRLTHRADHDPLTGVRNRGDLEGRLQRLIDHAQERGQMIAVLFVDLDRMKLVNDTFGHPVGDQVLREVAARLTTVAGPDNTVIRFGGDEFVVVLQTLPDVASMAQAAAASRAQELLDALVQPFQLGGETLNLTASIGVALVPTDATTASKAIERADDAMYEAKQDGRNSWRFASAELNAVHVPQANIEVQLRGALERGEFVVYFQPLVNMKTARVEGFEALLRWFSPSLGMVSPAIFVPIAESREMMGGIGRWVLRTALREAKVWRGGSLPETGVSVNVSATQFEAPDFVSDVQRALQEYDLAPSVLTLEVTESAVLKDVDSARSKLLELRALGVQIALDDFGMGFSSLGQLRGLPVNTLKIDRIFVQDSHQDNAAFVRAIVTLGHSLGLAVVAEGIEDPQMLRQLRAQGCDTGQGFYLGRPLGSAEAVNAVLALEGRVRTDLELS
jgi:diguanylate cyclase (GGDEF)-like protein